MKVYDWEIATTNWCASWRNGSRVLDVLMSALSNKLVLSVLLIVISIFFARRAPSGKKVPILSGLFLSVLLADLCSRHLVKEIIIRPRPHYLSQFCDHPSCFGFVSSHAADFFAFGAFLFCELPKNALWILPLGLAICSSRLFLYDHFPLDVLGGAALGCSIGLLVWLFVRRLWASDVSPSAGDSIFGGSGE